MTNRIAAVLALVIILILLLDHFYFHFGLVVILGRKFTDFVDYLQFWR